MALMNSCLGKQLSVLQKLNIVCKEYTIGWGKDPGWGEVDN